MSSLARKLAERLQGEVKTDEFTRAIYSLDASICQVRPLGVVLPRSAEDVLATIALAQDEGVPLTARGAATGTAGGCLGAGLVVDFARHLRQIVELNAAERYAICQPGVVQDQLNAAARPHGLCFGPDTSTSNRATLGGMVGNNSSGAHSMRYGKTVDNVLGLDLALADGELLRLAPLGERELARKTASAGTEGQLLRTVVRLREELRDEVAARFPKLQRRVSGYNLDELMRPGPLDLAKLVVGAEGTLGMTTAIKVQLAPLPAATGVCVVHVADLIAGLREVPFILERQPFAVELIDRHIVTSGRRSPVLRGRLGWLEGEPDGLLVVEFDGATAGEVESKLADFAARARRHGLGYAHVALQDRARMDEVWALRKAGLGLLMARRSHEKAIAFLEDIAVPPERVGDFMAEFRKLVAAHGKETGMYGHAGVGQIHTRPMLDLRQEREVRLMLDLMREVADMVAAYGGAISGEHGDGMIRSWLVERMFGPKLYAGFKELKRAFDPNGLMNPGKIVDPVNPADFLRVGPRTRHREVATQFDFTAEGGLAFAVEMCNGNAECRKLTSGTMCPSYQATANEYDSTRARATVLQGVLRGELPGGLAAEEAYRVLDLCLQCKGCRSECPSQVDMAKLKSEFLYHYQQQHGVPLRSRIFGAVDTIGRVGSALAPVSTWAQRTGLSRWVLRRVGIAPERELPPFARERFTRWFARQRFAPPEPCRGSVALLVDTYTECNYPELGQAAVTLMRRLGYQVLHGGYHCCGRPLISKGLLPQAKEKARRLLAALEPLVTAGCPVVGLEPSCILTLRDEYPALVPGALADQVAAAALTLDEWLAGFAATPGLGLTWQPRALRVWVHGHCHQKALSGMSPTLRVLRAVPGLEVQEIASGCCGMAGTFGYETEHLAFSLQVGETRLFPAVRALPDDAVIVADGLSCRGQIEHGTQRPAHHLATVLAGHLAPTHEATGSPAARP